MNSTTHIDNQAHPFHHVYNEDGIVVKYDEEKFKKLFTRILNLIENMASNVNQITARVNSTNRIYAEDLKQIEKRLNEVWQLQKFIQSQLQNPKL